MLSWKDERSSMIPEFLDFVAINSFSFSSNSFSFSLNFSANSFFSCSAFSTVWFSSSIFSLFSLACCNSSSSCCLRSLRRLMARIIFDSAGFVLYEESDSPSSSVISSSVISSSNRRETMSSRSVLWMLLENLETWTVLRRSECSRLRSLIF
ncbi:hypothetical protein M9Y10_034326 [Tritrichomonas musculus]|uniref:Uncharacterized protein n=1 Tax=Tritrichomonas musculus TaxID=1915356 RepID=A0ABR2KFC3_9EUKA